MSKVGYVNYHVHTPDRQAFHIDADGQPGRLIAPELIETQITLNDLRAAGTDQPIFARDGAAFEHAPSTVNPTPDTDSWQAVYEAELRRLLSRRIGARDVVIFDHTLRTDDPASERKPARNVHSDYSPDGAAKRLEDLLGPAQAAEWRAGHYAFINLWRPVGNPVNSAPLGFIRPDSVAPTDWVDIDLIYPDRRGHILGLAANPDHEWIYISRMTPEEVVYFNIYDNRGLPSVAHSAVDRIEDPGLSTVRQSLESRAVVRY